MVENKTAQTGTAPQKKVKKRTQGQEVWRRFKKNKGAMGGLFLIVVLVLLAIFVPVFVDYDTQVVGVNAIERLQDPSLKHPFGTDNLGRDIFLRVLYGTRYSLIIGALAVLISLVFGMIIGAFAGYKGGLVEDIILRLRDIFAGVPHILLAIALCASLGPGMWNMILSMGIASITVFITWTRTSILSVRNCEYIEAAKAIGATDWQIIMKHLLPNCLSPIIVQVTIRIGGTIAACAGLSFLGLGVALPTPEWGAMLSDGRPYITTCPWMTLFPGLAILVTVISFNLMGDGLRDALDPKLKT